MYEITIKSKIIIFYYISESVNEMSNQKDKTVQSPDCQVCQLFLILIVVQYITEK